VTDQPAGPPPFDPAHPQVGSVPAWLNVGTTPTPQGDMLILTVRVPNATVTAVMTKADGENWVRTIQKELDGMSSLVVAPANTVLPPMNGQSRP
jgi:phosphoenolpyruvate carboxylase